MRRFFALFLPLLLIVVACAGSGSSDSAPQPTSSQQGNLPPPTPVSPPQTPPPEKNPDEALPPVVKSVAPSKATVGSVGPTVIVSGDNFVERSVVQLDGAPLATTFVSATELRATIPTSQLTAVGTLRISVGTAPPGGGASQEVTFTVENPAPTLLSLNPMSVLESAPDTTLHVSGSGFVAGAQVVFGATTLTTTVASDTALDATIPAALLTTSGSVNVKVSNPSPGGGDSTTIAFTIANPNASIQSVTPGSAFVGDPPTAIVVMGSGFVAASQILFNGTALATTLAAPGELHATVPAASFVAPGDFPVAVSNPPPGGGVTAPYTFHVLYPAPSATSLSPSSTNAGAGATDVTVTGTNFFAASQITFDGAVSATTYIDGSHLKATLTAAQLASGGTIAVRVVTPAPGGGSSAALPFSVNNPAPTITSLSPASVTAGSPDRTITITGTGFIPTSAVKSNGVAVTTTYTNSTTVNATVPSAQLLFPGSVAITVTNPGPGGGTSAPKNLGINCDSSGVDVLLSSIGSTTTLSTNFAAAPTLHVFTSPLPSSGSCAATSLDTVLQPARYWVVQNTSGAPLTLAAWAVCTSDATHNDDGFITFYRRPTAPASDTERLACTGGISEGVGGSDWGSPEDGGSQFCPGLTKANGGGITLAACEKAVVHVQSWDFASGGSPSCSASAMCYTPPTTVRIAGQ
jgi:hypothetical protein